MADLEKCSLDDMKVASRSNGVAKSKSCLYAFVGVVIHTLNTTFSVLSEPTFHINIVYNFKNSNNILREKKSLNLYNILMTKIDRCLCK